MVSKQFEGFIEKLKEDAASEEAALVVIRFVDRENRHGIGDLLGPTPVFKEVLGRLKDKRLMEPKAVWNGLISVTATLFEECAVEKDKEWNLLENTYNSTLTFVESDLAMSPEAEFKIVRAGNANELEKDRKEVDENFRNKVINAKQERVLSETRRGFEMKLVDDKGAVSISVYLGEEAIAEYLTRTHKNIPLYHALNILGIDIPQTLEEGAKKEATKEAAKFYEATNIVLEEERKFVGMVGTLMKAAENGGGVLIGGAVSVVEDDDDIAVMTFGQRDELRDAYGMLAEKAKELRTLHLTRFVEEISVNSFTNVKVEGLLSFVENKVTQLNGEAQKKMVAR